MSNKIDSIIRKIKKFLGLCEYKHCFHRSIAEINIPAINVKRGICNKHLQEIMKISSKHNDGEPKGFINTNKITISLGPIDEGEEENE